MAEKPAWSPGAEELAASLAAPWSRAPLPTQRPGRIPGKVSGHTIPTAGFSDRRLGPGLAGQSLLPPEGPEQSLRHESGPPVGPEIARFTRDAALELHADEQPACPPPGCLADARPGERGAGFQTGLAVWLTAHSASSLSPCTEMI